MVIKVILAFICNEIINSIDKNASTRGVRNFRTMACYGLVFFLELLKISDLFLVDYYSVMIRILM
jgi:hypothetical protein